MINLRVAVTRDGVAHDNEEQHAQNGGAEHKQENRQSIHNHSPRAQNLARSMYVGRGNITSGNRLPPNPPLPVALLLALERLRISAGAANFDSGHGRQNEGLAQDIPRVPFIGGQPPTWGMEARAISQLTSKAVERSEVPIIHMTCAMLVGAKFPSFVGLTRAVRVHLDAVFKPARHRVERHLFTGRLRAVAVSRVGSGGVLRRAAL